MLLLLFAGVSLPSTKKFCGVRAGTAGNASLDAANGKDSLTLAEQGGTQTLLGQVDELIGLYKDETGTQNGQHYCAVVRNNSKGKPVKVIKAWRQQR